jgi:signal transduction histidine kinase
VRSGAFGRLVDRYGNLVLAAALVALGLCELFVPALKSDFHGPRALNVVLVVLIAAAVLWRRRAPLGALVAFALPASVWLAVVYGPKSNLPSEPLFVLLVLVYSAAVYASRDRQRLVLIVLIALFVSELALLIGGVKGVGNAVPGMIVIALAYAVGRALRGRHALAESLEQRALELEAERERSAAIAVSQERDRLARELHDVIAHSVSVIVVQAGAGERLLDADPERAREAFGMIRETGGHALDELRRLLGLLREGDGLNGAEPQPSLDRLDSLLAQARAGGVQVSCEVTGPPRPLPPGIGLAAYRIIQEALTNVRKHAGPNATATVNVRYAPGELVLKIADDGQGTGRSDGQGHGLIGMRERVALYGGRLDAGARNGRGFEVKASIPLVGASA